MTSPVGRIYATALSLFAFFVTWALVAAHPWPSSPPAASDPRLRALTAREKQIRREALVTRRVVERRWARYRVELARRNSQIAAARTAAQAAPPPVTPSVRIVSAPAATATSSS
jgi:hypothetical protein